MKQNSDIPEFADLVDLKRLEEMSEGGPKGMQELAQMYVDAMDLNLSKLQEAIHEQRMEDVEQITHSAVGSSSLIGINGLVPVLRKMEELGERKATSKLPQAFLELQTVYAHLCDFFLSQGIVTKK